MKKVVFIIPYFGMFPSYFKIWLKTVKENSTIDFLLFTDIEIKEPIPRNIRVIHWSFEKLQSYFQEKFDFQIFLDKPYKLCDFKPSFGYVFHEYISDYDFWGNCDIDCIFGDLRKYLDLFMEKYDVIGKYGHLSLYRNVDRINTCFKKEGALYSYKEVFSSIENYAFDEVTGVKRIFKLQGINCKFELDSMADIKKMHKSFLVGHGIKNYRKQIFLWDDGKVFQCFLEQKEIRYKEFMYLHFQKKCPIPYSEIKNGFYIFYDYFLPRIDSGLDEKMLERHKFYRCFIIKKIELISWLCKRAFFLATGNKKQRKINNYKRRFQ